MNMKMIFLLFNIVLLAFSQNFDWSAEIRNRGNFKMMNDVSDRFAELRSRLNLNITAESDVSAFFQLQDSRVFGSEANTLSNSMNLDLHQGYIKVDKLFDTKLSLKAGRMEMAYANQRIVGSIGWHNVGQAFDGSKLTYNLENGFVDLFGMKISEAANVNNDSADVYFYGLHIKEKISDDIDIEGFYYANHSLDSDSNLQTVGLYSSGMFNGNIKYEFMFAKQFGANSATVDYDGLYFFVKAGYKFTEDNMFSIAYESLSGNDGKDIKKNKSFNPIYGTNHKFNGFMDYFYVGVPSKLANFNGLNDLIFSYNYKTLNIDFHIFMNNQDVLTGPNTKLDKMLGNEIDLTYKYSYSKNLTFLPGFSFFSFGDDFKNSSKKNDFYAYFMMIFKL
jgi:hypothetical protein